MGSTMIQNANCSLINYPQPKKKRKEKKTEYLFTFALIINEEKSTIFWWFSRLFEFFNSFIFDWQWSNLPNKFLF